MQMPDGNDFLDSLFQDAEVQAAYEKRKPLYRLYEELTAARRRVEMTQEQVASAMGTSPSVVSRIESASFKKNPTLESLMRYADAVGHELQITLVPKSQPRSSSQQLKRRISGMTKGIRIGGIQGLNTAGSIISVVREKGRRNAPKVVTFSSSEHRIAKVAHKWVSIKLNRQGPQPLKHPRLKKERAN